MRGQLTNAAHASLEYVISRAFLEGKLGKVTISIPMSDWVDEHEGPRFENEALGTVLRITMNAEWAEGGDDFDADFGPDDEEAFND